MIENRLKCPPADLCPFKMQTFCSQLWDANDLIKLSPDGRSEFVYNLMIAGYENAKTVSDCASQNENCPLNDLDFLDEVSLPSFQTYLDWVLHYANNFQPTEVNGKT